MDSLEGAVRGALSVWRPALFRQGVFNLHSGTVSGWKVDCDALGWEDWRTLALMVDELGIGPYGRVEGVPRGGLAFASALAERLPSGARARATYPLLIADDVCTTGNSMEEHRAGRPALGVVAFARGPVPSWVVPLFSFYRR